MIALAQRNELAEKVQSELKARLEESGAQARRAEQEKGLVEC